MSNFTVVNETRLLIPPIPFEQIKNQALGKKYSLTLVFTNKEKMRKLNFSYRKINESTDILSFPLSSDLGEIYIAPDLAKEESVKFNREPDNFLAFLFIHGCIHLKGYDHGSTMENIEVKLREKFKI